MANCIYPACGVKHLDLDGVQMYFQHHTKDCITRHFRELCNCAFKGLSPDSNLRDNAKAFDIKSED